MSDPDETREPTTPDKTLSPVTSVRPSPYRVSCSVVVSDLLSQTMTPSGPPSQTSDPDTQNESGPKMTLDGTISRYRFKSQMKGEERGMSPMERKTIRRVLTPFLLHLLHFDRKDMRGTETRTRTQCESTTLERNLEQSHKNR